MDTLYKNFMNAIEELVSDHNMIAKTIDGDNKYYLKKTKYRIEIRSDESTTWLAYVMLPIAGDMDYKEFLFKKYIDLVSDSDSKHFSIEESSDE